MFKTLAKKLPLGIGVALTAFLMVPTLAAAPDPTPTVKETAAAKKIGGLGDPGKLESIEVGSAVTGSAVTGSAVTGSAGAGSAGAGELRGADARQQLVVTGRYSSGQLRDLTDRVAYTLEPADVVTIDASGFVEPLRNGEVEVTVRLPDGDGKQADGGGLAGKTTLKVTQFVDQPLVNFPNQVVPIFTKHGCNGGGCHGKSSGQNGFRLSLLGFYPQEDHEYLVKEGRGRRVFGAAPDRSLLLAKAINNVPHGGGKRFDKDSYEYRVIHRWMRQGMIYGNDKEVRVERIVVAPQVRTLDRRSRQQLSVVAIYNDGTTDDVTRMATYEANDTEMAEVSPKGVVHTLDLSGDIAVMVRYQGQVGVFRASVPLGIEVKELPPARNYIDELVFAKLKILGMPPSKICDDATFLRRVTIDVAGRTPSAVEARAFGEDQDPKKRDRLIDRLLAHTDYADNFTNKWSALLRNKKSKDSHTRGTYAFHEWLRDSFHRNTPYDDIVRGVLAASGGIEHNPGVVWYRSVSKVEQQVEDSAQLFLGLRIQCARCHHHPFEAWSQRDYYGYSAFFTRVGRKGSFDGTADEQRIFHNRGKATAKNPRTQETLGPTGLGTGELDLGPDDDPRHALVDWMSGPENPFFARALVNRYWKHFFGRGLVDPEDDMRLTNPASNPELLGALARRFIESRFDLKTLVRTVCQSTTYQLSAVPNDYNARDKQNFSRFYPRRLNAEVLYDALNQVTNTTAGFSGVPAKTRAVQLPDPGQRNYFLTVFGKPMADSACECERSNDANLAQSLHLLNSKDVLGKIAAANGRASALAGDAKRKHEKRIRELYFWVYSRPPDAEELGLATAHIKKYSEKPKEAYEDIVWALLNTKEFLFNH